MDSSSKTQFLISLLIFKNTLKRGEKLLFVYVSDDFWWRKVVVCFEIFCLFAELIRSLHSYRLSDGKESEVEREFVFSTNGTYMEMDANPLLVGLADCRVSDVSQGLANGLWVCIFAFHNHHPHFPHLTTIPSLLTPSKYPSFSLSVFIQFFWFSNSWKGTSRVTDEAHFCFYFIWVLLKLEAALLGSS